MWKDQPFSCTLPFTFACSPLFEVYNRHSHQSPNYQIKFLAKVSGYVNVSLCMFMTKFHAKWVKSMYSTMPHCQPEHTCKYQLIYFGLLSAVSGLSQNYARLTRQQVGKNVRFGKRAIQQYMTIMHSHARPSLIYIVENILLQHTLLQVLGVQCTPLVTTVVPEHNKWLDVSLVKPIEMSNVLCVYNCSSSQHTTFSLHNSSFMTAHSNKTMSHRLTSHTAIHIQYSFPVICQQ